MADIGTRMVEDDLRKEMASLKRHLKLKKFMKKEIKRAKRSHYNRLKNYRKEFRNKATFAMTV